MSRRTDRAEHQAELKIAFPCSPESKETSLLAFTVHRTPKTLSLEISCVADFDTRRPGFWIPLLEELLSRGFDTDRHMQIDGEEIIPSSFFNANACIGGKKLYPSPVDTQAQQDLFAILGRIYAATRRLEDKTGTLFLSPALREETP